MFLKYCSISTHKQYNAFVNITTHQHYNLLFFETKKRTTRITRTGLSKNNVTLIILNYAKTAIVSKHNNIIFTLKSIKLLT